MIFYGLLGAVAWICLALWPANIAKRKGYSFTLFLLLGILVSFIIALIVAGLLKDKNQSAADKKAEKAVDKVLHKQEGIED